MFGLTLGFSRRKYYSISRDETQASVFEALEAAFAHFGGAPKEVLVDNAKVFVTDAHPDRFAWNPRFLELCGHYAVEPVACQPYRPQTKGKVERPFFYLEQHFIKGRSWDSFDAITDGLARFIAEDLDERVHHTTQERPIDRFAREQTLLTPLPTRPFLSTQEQSRLVSWDCLVSFGGSRYSVPWAYAGQRVWVRPSRGVQLTIRGPSGDWLATHDVAPTRGSTAIDPAHYAGLRAGRPKTKVLVTQHFLTRFPGHEWFVEGIFTQHPPNGVAHLRAILGLADLYPTGTVIAALAAARTYDTYAHWFIRALLEAPDAPVAPPLAPEAPPGRPATDPLVADLTVYQSLLEETP